MTTYTDGPLVYINDDEDDQFIFERTIRDLGLNNIIHSFLDGQMALNYLESTDEKPLLILCDLNMPLLSGIALREHIDAHEHLKQKAIPFIFFTGQASPDQVRKAYEGSIQGFHIKAAGFSDLKEQIDMIINYWKSCIHPNSY